jgi:hypothetical protein
MPVACFRSRTTKNVQQIARFSEQKCGDIFGISRGVLIFPLAQSNCLPKKYGKSPREIPLASFAFLFDYSVKQKFDSVEVVTINA